MSDWTGMGPNTPAPKLDPNCNCICHIQPGFMHVAACCRAPAKKDDMTDDQVRALPAEIQAWRNNDALDHIGAWATTRYPAEAMTYVQKADISDDAVTSLLEELERGVRSMGMHEDGDTELFDIEDANEAMLKAAATIRALLQARADAAAAQALMVEQAANMAVIRQWTGTEWVDDTRLSTAILRLAPDAGTAELAKLRGEIERLTRCLKTANDNHEHFEREWYLAKDERNTLAASLAAQTALVETLTGAVLHHRKLDAEWHRMWRSGRDPGEEAETALEAAYDAVTAALEAAEISTMTPEEQAQFQPGKIAEGQG